MIQYTPPHLEEFQIWSERRRLCNNLLENQQELGCLSETLCFGWPMATLWLWQSKIFNQEAVSQDFLPYKQNEWKDFLSLTCWLETHLCTCTCMVSVQPGSLCGKPVCPSSLGGTATTTSGPLSPLCRHCIIYSFFILKMSLQST